MRDCKVVEGFHFKTLCVTLWITHCAVFATSQTGSIWGPPSHPPFLPCSIFLNLANNFVVLALGFKWETQGQVFEASLDNPNLQQSNLSLWLFRGVCQRGASVIIPHTIKEEKRDHASQGEFHFKTYYLLSNSIALNVTLMTRKAPLPPYSVIHKRLPSGNKILYSSVYWGLHQENNS